MRVLDCAECDGEVMVPDDFDETLEFPLCGACLAPYLDDEEAGPR